MVIDTTFAHLSDREFREFMTKVKILYENKIELLSKNKLYKDESINIDDPFFYKTMVESPDTNELDIEEYVKSPIFDKSHIHSYIVEDINATYDTYQNYIIGYFN